MRKPLSLSFRTRLVLAMAGAIAGILIVSLLVVDAQTRRVTETTIAETSRQADASFERVEQSSRDRLTSLGTRFAAQNRLSALFLDAQYAELDHEFLRREVSYELDIVHAQNTLVAFTDLNGEPLAAVLNGNSLPDPAAAIPRELWDPAIERADTSAFGYHLFGDHLYAVHFRLQRVVDDPIGIALLGAPIDDDVAALLRPTGTAHVCLAARDRCYASTLDNSTSITEADLIRHANSGQADIGGARWAFVSKPLPGGGPYSRIIAIPLDQVLLPFTRIQSALRFVGLAALLVGIGLALLLARGLARPIRALVHATERVARGDYDVEISNPSTDEIGQLAASFNHMTAGLRLKEKYRGVLDKVVSPEIAAEMVRGEIALGGETREVTTLFADIRGFTAMTEGMDPVMVISILNQVMERASDAVEAEGGVVDKYVGDEIMAIFGAPKSAPDDAARAVKAALRIRDAVAEFTREREAAGERGVGVGIGINTGPAVAGNMGSPRRLNYTVLGESVNIAARLCSEAKPQEILMAGATYERAKDAITAEPAGERYLKGISKPFPVFAAAGLKSATPSSAQMAGALALLLSLWTASPAAAQRAFQIDFSGRAEVAGYMPGSDEAYILPYTDFFAVPRVSLFTDIFVGDHIYGFVEMRFDRRPEPTDSAWEVRPEQMYLRFSPGDMNLNLQVGRFVTPFGEYPQRHHTTSDPFIRPPFPYEYRTALAPDSIATGPAAFLTWKDSDDVYRINGTPTIWSIPYQLGAMLAGGFGPLSFRAAVLNSAPASRTYDWSRTANLTERPSFTGHAGVQVTQEFQVGASFSRGPYISTHLPATLDTFPILPGFSEDRDDYLQQIWGVDAALTRGSLQTRAEIFFDQRDVPNVADAARSMSWSAEAAYRFGAGFDVAARAGAINFQDIATAAGDAVWDYDARRYQVAAGYRLSESMDVRLEYMINDSDAPRELDANMLSARVAWNIDRFWGF